MSQLRQLDGDVLVRSYGVTFSVNSHSPPKSEAWDQLVFSIHGVLTVIMDAGTWVVPPHRAIWLPADTVYNLQMSGQTSLRMLYFRARSSYEPSNTFDRKSCAVVNVSPLLRELILRTVRIGALFVGNGHHQRLAALIEDEMQTIDTVPLQLPYPKNTTARKFAEQIENRFGTDFDMPKFLDSCGASRRSIERHFRAETGMSLGQWIRRRKLLTGLDWLYNGETTATVAFNLGYSSPSAFIAMFKREIGETPTKALGR